MDCIELEILRSICYYDFYNIITNIFKHNFNIDNIPQFKIVNGYYEKVRQIIIRWIFILVMKRTNKDDPVFITQKSKDLEHQIKVDINTFFQYSNPNSVNLNNFSNGLIKIIYSSFKKYRNILRSTKIYKDNAVINNNSTLIYSSKSVEAVFNDSYVMVNNDKIILKYYSNPIYLTNKYNINIVFAAYFRYKYLYADNQTLAYDYKTDVNSGIECFSTPFNHYHEKFCSAFPDLESHLGSEGEFFNLMKRAILGKYNFPINRLHVNPPFDETYDLRISELTLKLLDTKKKYIISLIYPNWTHFKAVDILLESEYFIKSQIYKKGELYFSNYFTGKKVAPCDIIIIYLQN